MTIMALVKYDPFSRSELYFSLSHVSQPSMHKPEVQTPAGGIGGSLNVVHLLLCIVRTELRSPTKIRAGGNLPHGT
jgi:hypothetical protein